MARLPPGVRDRRKMDFAEALSRHDLESGDVGGRVDYAALCVGIAYHTGVTYLNEIKHHYGWQAR